MSANEHEAARTIDVYIAYEDPAHVESLRRDMEGEVGKLHGPVLDGAAQLVLAGSIGLSLFVKGVIDYQRKIGGDVLIFEPGPEKGKVVVRRVKAGKPGVLVFRQPDGRIEHYDLTTAQPHEVQSAVDRLSRGGDASSNEGA